ncbi:MAG: hypothetical protein PVI02_07205, partial [Gammaproteobacteria bacterium]
GQLIAFADDKILEGESGIQSPADPDSGDRAFRSLEPLIRLRLSTLRLKSAATSHLECYLHGVLAGAVSGNLDDSRQEVLPYPIHNKPVRRQQTKSVLVVDGLKGPDPRIEMLLRQIMLELLNTFVPERSRHRGVSQESKENQTENPAVYTGSKELSTGAKRGKRGLRNLTEEPSVLTISGLLLRARPSGGGSRTST